jgi:sugar phosphate isomerase/epimerase
MTDDELVEYMRRQIEAAAKLGFPIARVQISLTPDAMEMLLPVAERYGVVLALEVHAHQHGRHLKVLALRDRYEKLGSPLLGFTADWGATVSAFAPSLVEAYRRRGATPELIDATVALWQDYYREGPPMSEPEHGQRFSAFIELASRHGRRDLGVDMAINGTGLFGPAPVESWLEIMPWIRHVHGKFFGIDERGEEPSVPVRDLITLLVRAGYSGAISTEYEGWHWNYWQDAFEIVAGEQAVQRSAAEATGSRMVTDAEEARRVLRSHLSEQLSDA